MTGIDLAEVLKELADNTTESGSVEEDPLDVQQLLLKKRLKSYFKQCGHHKRFAKLALIQTLYPDQCQNQSTPQFAYATTQIRKLSMNPTYLSFYDQFQDNIPSLHLDWLKQKFESAEQGLSFIQDASRHVLGACLLAGFNRFHEWMLAYDKFKGQLVQRLSGYIKSKFKIKSNKFDWVQKIYQHDAVQHHLLPYVSQIIVAIIIGLNLGSGVGQSLGLMSTFYYVWSTISTAHHKTEHHTGPSISGYCKEKVLAWGTAFLSNTSVRTEPNHLETENAQSQSERYRKLKVIIEKVRLNILAITTPIMANLNLFSYPLRLITSIASVAWYYSGITITIPFVSGSVDSSTMSMLLLAYSLGFKNIPGYLMRTKTAKSVGHKISGCFKGFWSQTIKS